MHCQSHRWLLVECNQGREGCRLRHRRSFSDKMELVLYQFCASVNIIWTRARETSNVLYRPEVETWFTTCNCLRPNRAKPPRQGIKVVINEGKWKTSLSYRISESASAVTATGETLTSWTLLRLAAVTSADTDTLVDNRRECWSVVKSPSSLTTDTPDDTNTVDVETESRILIWWPLVCVAITRPWIQISRKNLVFKYRFKLNNKVLIYRRENRTEGCISFCQKWKTGAGRQYFMDIIGLSSTTVT